MRRTLTQVTTLLAVLLTAACRDVIAPSPTPLAPGLAAFGKGGQGKITICHAAGRAGTTHYIQITISVNAKNKHIDDHGTTQAGHEQDFVEGDQGRTCANAPLAGQLRVCVSLDPGVGGDPQIPVFSQTLTVTDALSAFVFSQLYTHSFGPTEHSTFVECSADEDVEVGTYRVDEPAPGVPEPPPHNGTWFIQYITGSIGGNPVLLNSQPNNTVTAANPWTAPVGRGQAGWAEIAVQANTLSVVTFYNHK